MCLLDLIFEWRGPKFHPWTGEGLAHNLGYFGGATFIAAFIGLIIGVIRDHARARRSPAAAQPSGPGRQRGSQDLAPIRPRQFNNFITKNWHGEYPLWMSYWVFVFLGNLIVGATVLLAARMFSVNAGYEPRNIFVALIVVWFCVVIVATWQLVGVWRSANRLIAERTRSSKRAPLAVLAKIAVVLGVLQLLVTFVRAGLPQITEVTRMAFMDDPSLPAYAMRIMRNGTEVEITGGFKYGLTDDFIRILRASPQIRVVHLDSLGGRLGEAEKLNKAIHDRRLITYVSSRCVSACTVAFAAGRERWLHGSAVLGFHGPAFPGMSNAELVEAGNLQKDVFTAAGFDPRFVGRALATPNKEMWQPSVEELLRAKVITAVSDGSHFAASGYGAELDRESMAAKLTKYLPVLGAVRERLPKAYAAITDGYYDGYVDGRTQAEIIAAARSKLLPIIVAYRPLADDAVLVDLGKLLIDQYAALDANDPTLCYLYASGADGAPDISSKLPKALIEREAALEERVVATAAKRPEVTEEMIAPLREKVLGQLGKRLGAERMKLLFADAPLDPSRHGDYCAASAGFFQEIAGLQHHEAALFMRHIFGK
jgi:hypothetical protein